MGAPRSKSFLMVACLVGIALVFAGTAEAAQRLPMWEAVNANWTYAAESCESQEGCAGFGVSPCHRLNARRAKCGSYRVHEEGGVYTRCNRVIRWKATLHRGVRISAIEHLGCEIVDGPR